MLLIKNARIIGHKQSKQKDILIIGKTIIKITEVIDTSLVKNLSCKVFDAKELLLAPGLIDGHAHVLGASGESGYSSRAPEIPVTAFFSAGITTVVGLLGLDTITRSPKSLLAKIRALSSEGMTARMLTGSYHLPSVTITGSVKEDIYLIPEVIGLGEIAIADHRSSQPVKNELQKLIKEVNVHSDAKGIRGATILHIGEETGGIEFLIEILKHVKIPADRIILTHINRNKNLLKNARKLMDMGYWIDLTALYFNSKKGIGFYHVEDAIRFLKKTNISFEKLTISSDSGCLIENNILTQPYWLFNAFQQIVKNNILPLDTAIQLFSTNPAHALGLTEKGSIEERKDADIVMLNKHMELDTVIANGEIVFHHRKLVKYGFFEKQAYINPHVK